MGCSNYSNARFQRGLPRGAALAYMFKAENHARKIELGLTFGERAPHVGQVVAQVTTRHEVLDHVAEPPAEAVMDFQFRSVPFGVIAPTSDALDSPVRECPVQGDPPCADWQG